MAHHKILPTQVYLQECFAYDSVTGQLRWRTRPSHHFSSERDKNRKNGIHAGKIVGCHANVQTTPRHTVYTVIKVRINNVQFSLSRVIMKLLLNIEPDEVDHIDGNPTNNRIENLRSCTHAENARNQKLSKVTNTSGFKGASYSKWRKGYICQITLNGKMTVFGPYATPEEAHAKYCELSAELHGEFGRVK